MQFSVPGIVNATAEANKANDYPDIRLFSVGQGTQSNTPLTNLATVQVQQGESLDRKGSQSMPVQPVPVPVRACVQELWSVADNVSVAYAAGGAFGYFSAVCWLFGR